MQIDTHNKSRIQKRITDYKTQGHMSRLVEHIKSMIMNKNRRQSHRNIVEYIVIYFYIYIEKSI